MHERDDDSVIRETLEGSPLFKHLSQNWHRRLVESSRLQVFESEEEIIEEGQEDQRYLFVLVEGTVEVWTDSPEGAVHLETLQPGAYFGEVSLLSDKISTAHVDAGDEDAEVIAIERECILELLQNDEKIREMLEGITMARAQDTIDKVLD